MSRLLGRMVCFLESVRQLVREDVVEQYGVVRERWHLPVAEAQRNKGVVMKLMVLMWSLDVLEVMKVLLDVVLLILMV